MGWTKNRSDLSQFLRNRRERIRPANVGLPTGPRRRAKGLRREEIAMLAGLSPTWYTYLEQGRDIRPSPEVLESLARVLQLSGEERRYLYLLVTGQDPPVRPDELEILADDTLVRVVDTVGHPDCPVYAGNVYGDVVSWNEAATDWYTDFARLPRERRNMLWWLLVAPEARERIANWSEDSQDLVARFRLASVLRPWDQRFGELASAMWEASAEFRQWWSSHEVSDLYPRTREFRQPDGSIRKFELVVLRVPDGFNSVVLHIPEHDRVGLS